MLLPMEWRRHWIDLSFRKVNLRLVSVSVRSRLFINLSSCCALPELICLDEESERQSLLADGFPDWSRKDFKAFTTR